MDRFFGIYVPSDSLAGMIFAIVLSVILGGMVGLEREIHAHPAGLRTHILVCLGACLATLVSLNLGHKGDQHIAAQVVTGVGFLGAGAIIRDGASVRGLTTAASIWATAGIGIALGAGPYFAMLGVIASLVVLFTLWVLNLLEDWLEDSGKRVLSLEVTAEDQPDIHELVAARVRGCGARVRSIGSDRTAGSGTQTVSMHVALGSNVGRATLISELSSMPGVIHVRLG